MSLSYELAKKLKDVGFPQVWPQSDEMEIQDALAISKIKEKYQKDVYIPSLSELIEACGEFDRLIKVRDMDDKLYEWLAFSTPEIGLKEGHGKTPEKAVANLYLELHKKV